MSSSIVFSYPTRSLKLARGHQICSGTTFVKSLGFHRHSLTSSVVNIGYVRKSNSRAFVLTKGEILCSTRPTVHFGEVICNSIPIIVGVLSLRLQSKHKHLFSILVVLMVP